MKPMLFTFLTFFWFNLAAQITITSASFPSVGDTIYTATDVDPMGIALGSTGGPKSWDFSALVSGGMDTLMFLDVSVGQNYAAFPDADMLTIGAGGAETYYRKTANEFQLLGFVGGDPTGFGVDVPARFTPPYIIRRAPMDFFDVNQSETDLSIAFSLEALPDSIVPGIPGIDSLRFRLHYNRLDVVDAYGDIDIPGSSHAVLREKRTEYVETAVDVYSFLGWQDLSGLFGNFAGIDTSVNYLFVSNSHKSEVANVQLSSDESTIESVDYKYNPMMVSTFYHAPGKASIQAQPNPAFEDVSFEVRNMPRNTYTLKIFDLVGKTIWKDTRELAGNTKIKLDLEDFKKGTYLYSLTDKNGRKFGTKRLVVIKP